MKVFISHSSHDDVAVRSLAEDLARARQQVWLDQDLGGGETWWAEILAQIRACTVVVFALSDNSLRSKACRAELEYAEALGLPILPVQIGHVNTYRTDPIFTKQLIDYRDSTRSSGIALVSALHERATYRVELPDPLPEPPPIPFEYLMRLGAAIRGNAELASAAQASMFYELRAALDEEDDAHVCEDIRELLRALRARRDVTYVIAREIDAILDDSTDPAPSDRAKAQPATNTEPTEPRRQSPTLLTDDFARSAVVGAHPAANYSGQVVLPFTGINPSGVAVDSAGAVYVTDSVNNRVLKLASGSSSQEVLPFTDLSTPTGVAVDSAGTVYVTDTDRIMVARVVALAAGSSTQVVLPFSSTDLDYPAGLAVDSAGGVYVAVRKTGGRGGGRRALVMALAAGSSTAASLGSVGLHVPDGVGVDSAGTVYFNDWSGHRVVALAAGESTPTVLPFTDLRFPAGVAVDSAGTVYVTDHENRRVVALAAGSRTQVVLPFTGLHNPAGVAVDNAGTVYVTDTHKVTDTDNQDQWVGRVVALATG